MSPRARTRDKDALISGVLSGLLMGLGQFRNKQKGKALFFFTILLIFIGIELLTGSYQYYASEIVSNPPGANGEFYFFRDYGGMFTRGLWGLFTLGQLVYQIPYRGMETRTFHRTIPWLTADNSVRLLIAGLIALVILSVLIAAWVVNIKDAYQVRKLMNQGTYIELKGKAYFKELYDNLLPLLLLIPVISLVAMFTIIPVMFSSLLAFTNYTYRIMPPARLIDWVGFSNFAQVVSDPAWFKIFGSVLLWTIVFAIMASVTCYALGFLNAIIIESKPIKFKRFWRMILIVPWAVPGMISLMVFKNAFDTQGLINQILYTTNTMQPVSNFLYDIGLQGQPDNPIYWLTQQYNGNLAKAVVIMVNLWLGAPYFMMLITGTLTTIPKDLYEAASIDGATGWKKFKSITLPLVLRGTAPAIVMTFTHNFNNFGSIYYLTGGGPNWVYSEVPNTMKVMGGIPGQTDILISWIFKLSFTQNAQLYNIAAVYSILIFIFVAVFSVLNLARNRAVWED
ncbi:MAG TPA: sugar ABC transporter permease [Erysipelothrix sp.]|nr:sugar ABC transporter permease [Erysipelothrix sp.]